MSKKPLFTTKTLVGTGLGAALFIVLTMFVKVPSPIPNTTINITYGVEAFFGVVFGPIAGGLIGLIGHTISDSLMWGTPSWAWVAGSAVVGIVSGLCYYFMDIESGKFSVKDAVILCVLSVLGNAIAWLLVAPAGDMIQYAQPWDYVFAQGLMAFGSNAITTCVLSVLLCFAYSKTRVKKGSLDIE